MTLLLSCLTNPLLSQVKSWYAIQPEPDGKTPFAVYGWAITPWGPPRIRISVDGVTLWEGNCFLLNKGVAELYPDYPNAERSGFWIQVDPKRFKIGPHTMTITALPRFAPEKVIARKSFRTVPPTGSLIAIPALLFILIIIPFIMGFFLYPGREIASKVKRGYFLIAIVAFCVISSILIAGHTGENVIEIKPGFFSALANWDGQWYLTIARKGYLNAENPGVYAYLPFFPFLLRILSFLPFPLPLLGSLFNVGCFVAAITFLRKIYPRRDNGWIFLLVFPFSLFFFVVYTESLFLLLAVLYYYFLKKGSSWQAFIVGFLAGMTRVPGALVSLFAIDPFIRKELRQKAAIAAAGPIVGIVSWGLYLAIMTGDAFKFLHVQRLFGRQTLFHPGALFDLLVRQLAHPQGMFYWEFIIFITVLSCGFALLKKGKYGESLFVISSVLLPLMTMRFTSINRYALVCFPVYYFIGNRLKSRAIAYGVFLVEFGLLIYFSIQFGNQNWVG